MFRKCGASRVGAAPVPILGLKTQTGLDGILFDVLDDSGFLEAIANPAVKIIASPEWLAGTVQQPIGFTCRASLNDRNNARQIHVGPQNHMNVIQHQHPGPEVEKSFAPPLQQNRDHALRDLGLLQPSRACSDAVQKAVCSKEFRSFGSLVIGHAARGKRATQSPCNEVCRTGLPPMRKMAMFHAPVVRAIDGNLTEADTRLAPRFPTYAN